MGLCPPYQSVWLFIESAEAPGIVYDQPDDRGILSTAAVIDGKVCDPRFKESRVCGNVQGVAEYRHGGGRVCEPAMACHMILT